MEADSQDHLPQHYILLDRYYIGRVLGQGGFGVTYLARDLRLDRVVAIKEYLPRDQCSRGSDHVTVRSYSGEKSDEFRYGLTTFLNEARNLSRLAGHPNIVSILDFAEANGTAYMVMEYIPGITLKKYLSEQGGVIPYGMAKEILLHVMAGLARTHEAGLIHRDVSPDNILISSHGPVKLIDFGAARQAIGEKSQNLTMVLKPGYAPEEQYRSKGVQGPWTDVYATAATMYRCITGQVPPPAPDRMADDELVPPGRLCRDLSPSVEAAILQGLAVRAAQRPQTIKEFQLPFTTIMKVVAPSWQPGPIEKEQKAPAEPVRRKSPRVYPLFLILGLALYAVSFWLVVFPQDPGSTDGTVHPLLGWICALQTLSMGSVAYTNYINGKSSEAFIGVITWLAAGLINPIFLLSLLLKIWRQTRKTALILAFISVLPQASCWWIFLMLKLFPHEGYYVWIIGMFTALLAGPLARLFDRAGQS